MPLPKALNPLRRQSSTSVHSRRNACRLCNNLDPRGHPNSLVRSDTKDARSSLTLVVDAFALSRVRSQDDGGCRFCGVLVQALDAYFEGWRGARKRILLDIKEKRSIKIKLDDDRWRRETVELYAGSASRSPWPTLGTAHHISSNSGSDEAFEFVRRCIQDCLTDSKHSDCNLPSKSPGSIPKRLMDVGRASSPIRLIDTNGKPFQYATLSHRWGTGPTLTATKSNWNKLNKKISFETLPPLFQDAIIITRQLGLRYLWIDSLCIIQDSTRDWETESAKMGLIYENSYITIAATNSEDGNRRCLVGRPKPTRLHYKNTTGKEFVLRARRIQEHHPNPKEGEPAKPTGPLTSRAWALQEHVLSTRILHYTETELVFECRSGYRCECMPSKRICITSLSMIPKAIAKKKKDCDILWTSWHRVTEKYSERDLTVQTDKLPAISGIASKIEQASGSSYIAGLWKNNLAADLLWSASFDEQRGKDAYALDTYRAPTFSWASLDAPVTYYTPDAEEAETFSSLITLVSSSVSPTGLNPLGTVSEASIQLRGPCLNATLVSSLKNNRWDYTLWIKGTSAIRIAHDCLLVEARNSSSTLENSISTVRRAKAEDVLSEFKAPVVCLGVGRFGTWISGLVFGISQVSHGGYMRIGTFSAGTEVFQDAPKRDLIVV